jgi:hypothetical protein
LVLLIILGVLLALIVLLCMIPVGFDAGYEQGQAHVSAKVMGLLLQLYPKPPPNPNAKPKKEKPKKDKPKEEKPKAEKPRKKPSLRFSKDEILELIKAVLTGAGRFGKKLKVDRFVLHVTLAGDDPCDTALLYGWLNAALSTLAPIARRRFTAKDVDVWTELDFNGEDVKLDIALAMSIRIGQILGAALHIAFKALAILLKNKRRLKREAKLQPAQALESAVALETGMSAAESTDEMNTTAQNTGTEERTESNGNGD